jgi:hypothetical protein
MRSCATSPRRERARVESWSGKQLVVVLDRSIVVALQRVLHFRELADRFRRESPRDHE